MRKICLILVFLFTFLPVTSQDVELNRINAKEEFKWGVKFFNQALYEKAVFSFERSLSFDSLDLRTHLWLGHAYFMKGDVDAALDEWQVVKDKGALPLWLERQVEFIEVQRGVLKELYDTHEWVTLYQTDISRPSSIMTMDSGISVVVSFIKNSIDFFNSNGARVKTFDGGFEAFNRPFDIIKHPAGGYIVSEFMGDQITFVNDLGVKMKSFSTEGTPLAGPGFLALDSKGYFYVSDWGNRRVCKFDMEGNYILDIQHELLRRPAGLQVLDNSLYISDAESRSVMLFDLSGNYLDTLITDGLDAPEGLSLRDDKYLVIADGETLKEFDLEDKILTIISDLSGKASRITKGVVDVNGNTLVTDFNLGQMLALTDVSSLYGGLQIIVDRISIINFPKLRADVQVLDREGEPIVGLDNSNFLISENSKIVPERDVIFRGSDSNSVHMGVILDMDRGMEQYLEQYYDISSSLEGESSSGDVFSLFKAGDLPVKAAENILNISDVVSDITEGDFLGREGIDQTIELAASTLLNSKIGREILLISDGVSKNNDFIRYSLSEVRDFLKNNRISLSVVYLKDDINDELEYLVKESGGVSEYLFSGSGVKGIISTLRKRKSGFYVIEFDSLKNIDNGEVFSSVEVEVNYIRKSGRAESGFFVPVKVVN